MLDLEVGQKVRVKNCEPKPPAHHKKKFRAWMAGNYDGEIVEVQEEEYRSVLVKNLDTSNEIIENRNWIHVDDPARSIIPIEEYEAELADTPF